jgi:hypothetical protein
LEAVFAGKAEIRNIDDLAVGPIRAMPWAPLTTPTTESAEPSISLSFSSSAEGRMVSVSPPFTRNRPSATAIGASFTA